MAVVNDHLTGTATPVRSPLDLLDDAEVTEDVFHDAVHGVPLVEALLTHIGAVAAPQDKVLAIGPSPLLALVLCDCYRCDLATLGGDTLPAAMQARARFSLSPSDLAVGTIPVQGQYAVIVLPFALDFHPGDPRSMMLAAAGALRADGHLVLAGLNQVKLGSRLRSLRGRDFLPLWSDAPVLREGGWPLMPEYRHYTAAEVAGLAESLGLTAARTTMSVGLRAYNAWLPLSPLGWAKAKLRHALNDIVPSWRPYWVVSLERPK